MRLELRFRGRRCRTRISTSWLKLGHQWVQQTQQMPSLIVGWPLLLRPNERGGRRPAASHLAQPLLFSPVHILHQRIKQTAPIACALVCTGSSSTFFSRTTTSCTHHYPQHHIIITPPTAQASSHQTPIPSSHDAFSARELGSCSQ